MQEPEFPFCGKFSVFKKTLIPNGTRNQIRNIFHMKDIFLKKKSGLEELKIEFFENFSFELLTKWAAVEPGDAGEQET